MRAVIVGGSIAGLSSALFLARDGWDVTILEGDDAGTPDTLGPEDEWFRKGTPHSKQAHAFLAGAVKAMAERVPDVLGDIEANGAVRRSKEVFTPPQFTNTEGDDELVVLNARRPMVELTLRKAVLEQKGITFRGGVHVSGVRARTLDGVPHVDAVIVDGGDPVAGDFVIDCSGRRTQVDRWLDAIGARAPGYAEESCGQLYFGRYYLRTTDEGAPSLSNPFLSVFPFPWATALMFPGDSGVMQFAVGSLPEDEEMKSRLRRPEAFHAFISSVPHIQEWAACGKPVSDTTVMGNLNNHIRRLVVDGEPVVTGLHLVGDSAAITNPQYGRGVSHAIVHAAFVASVVASYPYDLRTQASLVDDEVTRMLEPSVNDSITNDRARTAFWRAGLRGEPPPAPSGPLHPARIQAASNADEQVWRAVTRSGLVLDPPGAWRDDEEFLARIESAASQDVEIPELPPAPSRANLIETMDKVM